MRKDVGDFAAIDGALGDVASRPGMWWQNTTPAELKGCVLCLLPPWVESAVRLGGGERLSAHLLPGDFVAITLHRGDECPAWGGVVGRASSRRIWDLLRIGVGKLGGVAQDHTGRKKDASW
jgi:hypothetical protein